MHSMTLAFDLDLDLGLDMTKIYFMPSDLDFGLDMSKNVLDDLWPWPLTLTCQGHYAPELSSSSYYQYLYLYLSVSVLEIFAIEV